MRKLRLDNVLVAADLCRGNQTRAAERLGVTRWALVKFIRRTPRARQAFDEWRQRLVDEAETALWDCVAERQPWAVALVVKTLGKFRGYIEAKDLSPTGQTRLPQGAEGQTDEDFILAMRPTRPAWGEADDPGPDSDPAWDEADDPWDAREAELIARFQEERQTLIASFQEERQALMAKIEMLEAAVVSPTDTPPSAPDETGADEADAIKAQIAELMTEVKKHLGRG
jgi:hypothetical protein